MELSELTTDDGISVVSPSGRLTMVGAPDLRDMVSSLVQEGRTRLVVDLSGVTFLDSSGLGALVAGLKSARQAGGDLRIAAASEQVLLVLKLTSLDRVLEPHASVEAAFAELRPRDGRRRRAR